MNRTFWLNYHSIMVLIIFILWVFTGTVKEIKDIGNNLKHSKKESKKSRIETIILIIIVCAFFLVVYRIFKNVVLKSETASMWFVTLYMIVYAYIAIKQMIRMIFIPEKRVFSVWDIQRFTLTYLFWWFMVVVMNSLQPQADWLSEMPPNGRDTVKVILLFICYYFNIVFTLGGLYILLYHIHKGALALQSRFRTIEEKVRQWIERLCSPMKNGEKYTGLRSVELWNENGRSIVYKIFMFIPLLLFDVLNVVWMLVRTLTKMLFAGVVLAIINPIREVCILIRKLWNRHENNEWMYVFAQIAGLCSYIIVYFIIQYGEYEEVPRNVYEFVGTIILIPYFLDKIINVKNKFREKEVDTSSE